MGATVNPSAWNECIFNKKSIKRYFWVQKNAGMAY